MAAAVAVTGDSGVSAAVPATPAIEMDRLDATEVPCADDAVAADAVAVDEVVEEEIDGLVER